MGIWQQSYARDINKQALAYGRLDHFAKPEALAQARANTRQMATAYLTEKWRQCAALGDQLARAAHVGNKADELRQACVDGLKTPVEEAKNAFFADFLPQNQSWPPPTALAPPSYASAVAPAAPQATPSGPPPPPG